MNINQAKRHLNTAISLSEAYLSIADRHSAKEELNEALKQTADHRLSLLEDFGKKKDFDLRQGKLQEAGAQLLDQVKNSREAIHVEYELSFFGINIARQERFRPIGLERLTLPSTRNSAINHLEWAADSIITWDCSPADDMGIREDARWTYSTGRYLEGRDLNEFIWHNPTNFTDLKEELTEFLKNKDRILEVGFLHQRVKNLIFEINPNIEYHGVDISIPAVSQARSLEISAFNSNAWYSIPYTNDFFDGIISTTIQAAGLFPNEEWSRVLKDKTGIFNVSLQ